MRKTVVLLSSVALTFALAAAPSVVFNIDATNRVTFTLCRDRGAAADAPWASVGVEAQKLSGGKFVATSSSSYRFNSSVEPLTFSSMDDLYRWQEATVRRTFRNPVETTLLVEAQEEGEWLRFYVNGTYMCRAARNGAEANLMRFKSSAGFPIAIDLRCTKANPRFETVDITDRANACGLPGRKPDPASAGKVVERDGVPFLLSRDPKLDSLDISMSWNPAAFRAGFSACKSGKRWADPRLKTPLRYQFAVPGRRDYDALYVLCASDDRMKNSIPRFSVQFFCKDGRPFNFASETVPVAADGKLAVVKVPLSGDLMTEFGPEWSLNFELTKDVFPYRTYADPLNHSWHAGGLPSNVRIYGVTLSRAPVTCTFKPLQPANIFGEDEQVGYEVTLENTTGEERTEKLRLAALDWYGKDPLEETEKVTLDPGERRTVTIELDPERFGWYRAELTAAGRTWSHSFVRLRKREYDARPFEEKCIRAGTWSMFHSPLHAYVTGKGGWDTSSGEPRWPKDPAAREKIAETMRRFGMRDFQAPSNKRAQRGIISAKTPMDEGCAAYAKRLPAKSPETEFHKNRYAVAICEPGGVGTDNAGFPEYYGEPENAYDYRKLEGWHKTVYENYKRQMQVAHKVLRERFPEAALLMPHGRWTFLAPFLQDPEARNLADGVMMDFQYYTRLPEEQIHQTSLNSVMIFRDFWRKYRPNEEPLLVWGEGPDVTQVYAGGSSQLSAASHSVRISMLMAGYGCNIQTSWSVDVITYRESHCGGAFVAGVNALDPDLSYAAFSAWLRHARHATHESFTCPGSTSAFCQNFRDHRTGGLFRGIWTIRGTRDFIFDCDPDKLTVYDPMDNLVEPEERGGKAVVRVGEMPFFVYGAEGVAVSLGEPDHSDACTPQLGRDYWKDPVVVKLGELGALGAEQCADADKHYVDMMPDQIRRFPVTMDVKDVDTEKGRAVSVGLPPQKVDRMIMPYFTCIRFKKPIEIPGKATALRLDVKAASDWGRVVYVLKDAEGRRWYSCGRPGEWNMDDMPGDSVFCFDGWRTLRFELPFNEPWDGYRSLGFTCWGSDKLKAKVALPVALEKIFVERRSGVIYGCEFRKFESDTPVLLGALSAEYEKEEDRTPAAYELQKVVAPKLPDNQLPDTIGELAKKGTLEPGRILSVKDPDTWFDGTRGIFTFEMPTNAVSADMWMSLNPDGRGALKIGRDLKKSPHYVEGFLADTTFYAYLVWKDKAGNASKPSEPFKFKMIDHFGHQ